MVWLHGIEFGADCLVFASTVVAVFRSRRRRTGHQAVSHARICRALTCYSRRIRSSTSQAAEGLLSCLALQNPKTLKIHTANGKPGYAQHFGLQAVVRLNGQSDWRFHPAISGCYPTCTQSSGRRDRCMQVHMYRKHQQS